MVNDSCHMRSLLALILALWSCSVPGQTVHNLVMEGAGIRGLAYCGALEELSDQRKLENLDRVAGTSAGAIVACFLSVGYTPKEIADIVGFTDFGTFNDGEYFFIGGTERMLSDYGWYQGEAFLGWLESHVSRKTGSADLTFNDLHAASPEKNYLDLYVTGTNLSRQCAVTFSYETYPDMRIVDAVRTSMSVPLWFEAVHLDSIGGVVEPGEGDVFVDGGVLTNFPIDLFDAPRYYTGLSTEAFDPTFKNPQTLGLRMDSDSQIDSDQNGGGLARQEINDIEDHVRALYVLVIEELNRHNLSTEDWKRTISISDTALGPRVKQLEPEQKSALLDAGREAVIDFYSKTEE